MDVMGKRIIIIDIIVEYLFFGKLEFFKLYWFNLILKVILFVEFK